MKAQIIPMLKILFHELKEILRDKRYLISVFLGMFLTLAMTFLILGFIGSFKEGTLLSSMPVSAKLAKIAVVVESYHQSIDELEKSPSAYLIYADRENAFQMLGEGKVHGIYFVSENRGTFIGGRNPLSSLAEYIVQESVDRVVRRNAEERYEFREDAGLESLIKGLLSPILLLSPIFIWCLPVLQSISYDRERKTLEVLFATPLDRKSIILSKIGANFLFVAFLSFIWLSIVYLAGFRFSDPFGVHLILLVLGLLVISMNALVSTITTGVQEATLAASIISTAIFTVLFSITIFKAFPQTAAIADISPATYIAREVGEASAPFPINSLVILLIISASAILLAVSAFSTEVFAFSLKPGIMQLYEGMLQILGDKRKAAFGMGFVAFSLTTPAQLIVLGLLFFTSGANALLIMFGLVLVEETLKGLSIFALKPKNVHSGILYGALVGLSFGLSESSLYTPLVGLNIYLRAVPIFIHILSSAIVGMGYPKKLGIPSILLASALHFTYNYSLIRHLL
ncbi:MAG: ABC transporter permease [Candidatus Micrarchaeia archaeon]